MPSHNEFAKFLEEEGEAVPQGDASTEYGKFLKEEGESPAVEVKPASIPETEAPKSPEQVSTPVSALAGGAQGLSSGWMDELLAAAGTRAELARGNVPFSFPEILEAYKKQRDVSRGAFKKAEEAHPSVYSGAALAGAAVPIIATGGTSAMPVVTEAALQGAAAGLGASEAELASKEPEVGQAALETGVGAALGGMIGKTGKALSELAPESLKRFAGRRILAYLNAPKNVIEKEMRTGMHSDVIAKHNITELKGGPQPMLEKIEAAQEKNRQEFHPILEKAQEDLKAIISNKDKLEGPGMKSAPSAALNDQAMGMLNQFDDVIASAREQAKRSGSTGWIDNWATNNRPDFIKALKSGDLKRVNELKIDFGKAAAMSKKAFTSDPDAPAKVQLLEGVTHILREGVENLASIADPKYGVQIKSLNREWGALNDLGDAAHGLVIKDFKDSTALGSLAARKGVPLAGAAIEIARGHPTTAAMLGAGALAEGITGQSLYNIGRISAAKGGLTGAKALEKMPALQQVLKAAPDQAKILAKEGARRGVETFGKKAPVAPPPVQQKDAPGSVTPNILADNQGKAFAENYSDEHIDKIKAAIPDDGKTVNNVLRNMLEAAKQRDANGRSALIFQLKSNPLYRPILERALAGEQKEKENER